MASPIQGGGLTDKDKDKAKLGIYKQFPKIPLLVKI